MAEQRKDSRSAASLKVKYKSASVDEFVSQFGTDVSRGGIFVKTKSPLEAGALLKLEMQLSTSAAVIAGIGRVVWRRTATEDAAKPAGMGIKFVKLEPASQAIVDRIVAERGAAPSRFDQTEGAELEPPARASLPPERTSSPNKELPAKDPATVRRPAAVGTAAVVPTKPQPLAGKPVTSQPAPAPSTAAGIAAASRPRLAPVKANVPSGLFANSPLVQPGVSSPPLDEKRMSFFPPAPTVQPVARGSSTASGQLNAPRSSSGSVSSPLHRPGSSSRAPNTSVSSRAPAPAGPKGVFGGPQPSSPLASSASGLLRPATEVSSVSPSSLLSDRSADEAPTAAVPRPPGGRNAARAGQASAPPVAAPSALDALSEDLFDTTEGSGASSVDGMFATLEPLADAPPAHASSPKLGERVSAPLHSNGGMRDPSPRDSSPRGLAAAEAADVDSLFAELEGNDDAPTDELPKPSAASAVFSPGSTRPSLPPLAEQLSGAEFGEADPFGGDDIGTPPFDGVAAPNIHDGARTPASEPPMLRLAEPAAAVTGQRKRSPGLMIGIGAIVLIVILGAALASLKPELLVQWGLVAGEPPRALAPPPPAAPVEVPAQPMMEAAAAQAPAAQAPQAPQAPAEMIQVNVTSLPRGADVRVDGVLKSQTPTNVALPLGREANVTVSAQGHAAQARLVTAKRGMDPLRFKLEPLPYVLVVISTPPGAELSVGSVTSVSPAPLALGHVSGGVDVAVTKNGYRRMTRSVRLDEFIEKDGVLRAEIQVSLSPMPGSEADSAPADPPARESPPSPSSRRRRGGSRTPDAPLPPPDPEAAQGEPRPEAEAGSAAEPAPAKAPGAPPAAPSLPSLP